MCPKAAPILAHLTTAEHCRSRLVCKQWNCDVKQLIGFEVVYRLPLSKRNAPILEAVKGVFAAHQHSADRQSQRLKVCLANGVSLEGLVTLLQGIIDQVLTTLLTKP